MVTIYPNRWVQKKKEKKERQKERKYEKSKKP